jgi:hypothetical protein
MRHKRRKCPFFLCEQTVKWSKQDNRDNPGKDQRVLKTDSGSVNSVSELSVIYVILNF